MSGDLKENLFAFSIAQVIGFYTSEWMNRKLKTKKAYLISFSLCILGQFLLIVFHEEEHLQFIFLMITVIGQCQTKFYAYINHVKLIPSMYTTSTFGISNLIARMVSIFAPIVAEQEFPTPSVTNILMSIIAICLSFIIYEDLPKHM